MNKVSISTVAIGLCLPLMMAWGDESAVSAASLLSIGQETSRHAIDWGTTEAVLKRTFPELDSVPENQRYGSKWRRVVRLNDVGCTFSVVLASDHQRDSLASFLLQYVSGPSDVCNSRLRAVLTERYGPPQGPTQSSWDSPTTCFGLVFNPSQRLPLYISVGDKRQGDACGHDDQVIILKRSPNPK
jgi:hypothetical protein